MTRPSLADGLALRGLRGATTCDSNSVDSIEAAVDALVTCLVDRTDRVMDVI